jgi:uncharacterized protein
MEQRSNVVGWFELPVLEMNRAMKFYETVLDMKLERHRMGEFDMAWFPFSDAPGSTSSLVYHKDWYRPSADGVLIYFTAQSGDLANELARVEDAGGEILIPKRLITEDIGYMAVIADTEGNKVALHSRS